MSIKQGNILQPDLIWYFTLALTFSAPDSLSCAVDRGGATPHNYGEMERKSSNI